MNQPRTNPVEDLLRDAEWMRALARRLVTDGDHVDDAIQDAWVVALEKRDEPRAGSRPWIAGVFKNLARERWRRERARERRERVAARPEALPATDDVVARAQGQRLLVESVLALDEPYRSTILRHYFDGVSAEELARHENVPGSTVRNRLSRGIAELRHKLERDGGAGWAVLLVPLADLGTSGGIPVATTTSATASKGSAVPGGLAMSSVATFGLGIVGVVALAWWTSPGDARPEALALGVGPRTQAELALAESTHERDAARIPAVAAMALEEASSTNAANVARGLVSLLVHVTWAEDGLPAADVPVRVHPWGAPDPFVYSESRATGADGSVRFEGLHPGELDVLCAFGGDAKRTVVADESAEISIAIPIGVIVEGQVVDALGRAVPDAAIWLSAYGNLVSGEEVARSGSDGRFRLRAIDGNRHVAARARGFAPSPAYGVDGSPGDTARPRIVMTGPGGALRGTVRGPHETPVAGALVQAGTEMSNSQRDADGLRVSTPPPQRVRSDRHGNFQFDGVAPGEVPIVVRLRGFAPWVGEAEVAIDRTADLVVELGAGAVVRGTVREANGQPLERVIVGHGAYGEVASAQTYSALDGSFVLEGLPVGVVELRAGGRDTGKLRMTPSLQAGDDITWNPVLVSGPGIAGRVLDDASAPLANWIVTAIDGERVGRALLSMRTNERGEFELVDWPEEARAIEVHDPDAWTHDAIVTLPRPRVGQRDLVLCVPRWARTTASLEGRIVDEHGGVIVGASVSLRRAGERSGSSGAIDTNSGTFRFSPIPPGTFRVSFEASGRGRVELPELTIASDEHRDLGTIVLAPAGSARVEFVRAPGSTHADRILASIFDARGRFVASIASDDSVAVAALSPGPHRIHIAGAGVRADEIAFVVESGVESIVRVRLEPATSRTIGVALPRDFDRHDTVHVEVKDAHGEAVLDVAKGYRLEAAQLFQVGGLAVGTYTVEASTNTGATGRVTFDVLDLRPDPAEIRLSLR